MKSAGAWNEEIREGKHERSEKRATEAAVRSRARVVCATEVVKKTERSLGGGSGRAKGDAAAGVRVSLARTMSWNSAVRSVIVLQRHWTASTTTAAVVVSHSSDTQEKLLIQDGG